MSTHTPVTSPALIPALFGTWVCGAANYPAGLEQATGLAHSQPRAAASPRNCRGLAADLYSGQLLFLIRGASCFLYVSRGKAAHQLPGEEGSHAARQGHNESLAFVKLPPATGTSHLLTYPRHKKPGSSQNTAAEPAVLASLLDV